MKIKEMKLNGQVVSEGTKVSIACEESNNFDYSISIEDVNYAFSQKQTEYFEADNRMVFKNEKDSLEITFEGTS